MHAHDTCMFMYAALRTNQNDIVVESEFYSTDAYECYVTSFSVNGNPSDLNPTLRYSLMYIVYIIYMAPFFRFACSIDTYRTEIKTKEYDEFISMSNIYMNIDLYTRI